jgi:hypothetical protein
MGKGRHDKMKAHTTVRPFGVLVAMIAVALFCFSPSAALAAGCPNEALRESQVSEALPQGSTVLPNCMALELVSPPKKFNQYAQTSNFSVSGDRIAFQSAAALAETPKQGSISDIYIATRTGSGWVTQPTSAPPELVNGSGGSATPCAYSPDLSRWGLFGSTVSQAPLAITTAFRNGLDGVLSRLGPTLAPLSGKTLASSLEGTCEGASIDVSRFLYKINRVGITYLPGDPVPMGGILVANVYEAYLEGGVPTLALLQRDRDGAVYGGSCGSETGSSVSDRGALSPDATRIYFTARISQPEGVQCNTGLHRARIMLRQQTPLGPEISELTTSECTRVSPPCSSADGDDTFLGASQQGDKVFFSTTRQLADSDLDATADLYLFDGSPPPGERLSQVSAGEDSAPTPGEGADFQGLVDFAGDGTRAYFVAMGALTATANGFGETAEAGKPNLYLYQRDAAFPSGRTVFIATLAPTDAGTWISSPGESNMAMAVPRLGTDPEGQAIGGDGHLLVFASREALTPDDIDGGSRDLFRYDSNAGSIARISTASPGGEDNGAFEVFLDAANDPFPGPHNITFGRWVSEDGDTVTFATEEALDPVDTNGKRNAYIWREGEVTALPFAIEPAVSMSGDEVSFTSSAKLLPEDGDAAKDVYVARANGGFLSPAAPQPCQGEACQGAPSAPPAAPGIVSEATGPGNPQMRCRKGFARKRGRCVKRNKQRRRHKQRGRSSAKRGGQR